MRTAILTSILCFSASCVDDQFVDDNDPGSGGKADGGSCRVTTSPPTRTSNAMVAMPQGTYMFAGFQGVQTFDDTWAFDGCTWHGVTTQAHPPARVDHSWEYFPTTGVGVMFGGAAGPWLHGDTWTWDGKLWRQLSPAKSPSPRLSAAMTYDAGHDKIVMFGGWNLLHTLDDTWLFDGTSWTQANPATHPSRRLVHELAYDEARDNTVLFGGWDGLTGVFNDTWTWDGSTWTQRRPATSPPPRFDHGIGYDRVRQEVVVFGGQKAIGIGAKNDTWVWNGTTWTQRRPAHSPSPRVVHGLVWDENRGQLILFGGWNGTQFFGDTWAWTGTDWQRL